MHAIVDTSVLNAEKYYRTYKRETSPAGNFSINQITTFGKNEISLLKILETIQGDPDTNEFMIATHANPNGLIMPLIKKSSVSAHTSVMEKILEIIGGVNQRTAIDSLAKDKQFKAWQAWFRKFEPGVRLLDSNEENDGWPDFVKGKYQEWHERQGKGILKLPNPNENLPKLLDAVKAVRNIKLKRLEFRACRIGKDEKALKKIAGFFQTQKIIAPKNVRTFYGAISNVTIITDRAKYEKALKQMKNRRAYPGVDIGLDIGASTFKVIAPAQSETKNFVNQLISSKYQGKTNPFVIGGLEPTGNSKSLAKGKKHVFPLESEYKKLLTFVDLVPKKSP